MKLYERRLSKEHEDNGDDITKQALLLKGHKMKRETWIRNVMKIYPEKSKIETEELYDKIFNSRSKNYIKMKRLEAKIPSPSTEVPSSLSDKPPMPSV